MCAVNEDSSVTRSRNAIIRYGADSDVGLGDDGGEGSLLSMMQCDDASANLVSAVVAGGRGDCERLCKEMMSMFKGWRVTRRENVVLRLTIERMKSIAAQRQTELEQQVPHP